ncbi:MAG: FKBP-type peptidyl-prolyl cis-trans isomerase N-terminal domain-containing protein [Lysobacteraceae bacterium]
MSVRARGLAVWMAALLLSLWSAGQALADDKAVAPMSDRDRVSYMIGADVGRSIASSGPDMEFAAFERAIRNAFAGGQPLLTDEESRTVGTALMQRIAERNGRPVPGLPPGARPPAVAKDKVGLMVGTDVGRSLAPIKDEIEMPVFLQAVRTLMASGKPLLSEAEMDRIRADFSKRMDAREQERAANAGRRNAEAGAAFLAKNRTEKGVITTASGLQYRVLRQGNGPRPRPSDRVRVHYRGTLLDGTVFDSSYDRGQPVEFALGQVIAGWTEGLSLMPVGAKYRFWIPASIAYGERGSPPTIGPNATLTFDVELLDIP